VRPPILWIAVGFGAGLWAGLGFLGEGGWGAGLWVAVPILAGALLVARSAPVGAATGVALVAGVLWGGAAVRERAVTCAGRWAGGPPGVSHGATLRLADPAPAAGGVIEGRVIDGACGGTLRLRWPAERPARGGTTWAVAGRWLGAADRGVLVVRRARQVDAVPRGRGALRDAVTRRTAALFGSRAPLVDALVINRRAELDPKVREQYARSGLAHILSISGLHVGFLAAWLALALRRLRPAARFWACAALILVYVWLLGWPAPAARAALMLLVDGIGRLRQRVVAPRGSIALAALCVMFLDAWVVRSVGAWLSVAAIAAVIWGARATATHPLLARLLVPSVAATLVTAPITAWAFGTVAPIGVVLNLVAVPLSSVVVPGLILALLASSLLSGLGALFAAGSGLGLALLDALAAAGARMPGGHLVHVPGWQAALLWTAVAAAAWWLWHAPRGRWVRGARLAFLAALVSWSVTLAALARDEPPGLAVYFLDVGQGDAALLRTPGGHWVLIDGGPRQGGRDAGRAVIVPFLRRHGAESLTAVVATHGHADHIGGLPVVLEAFPPAYVLEPGEPLAQPLYLEFLAAVEASGARWQPARAGDKLQVDGVVLEVLSPDSTWLGLTRDVNEHSVVLRVRFGAERLVFAGDAGLPVEARLAGRVGPVRLLKVGHHASRSATSDAWLTELAPREAVISVGRRNTYGHPAPEVLARLARHGVAILRTDRDGTITFSTDGTRETTAISHQPSAVSYQTSDVRHQN